MSILMVSQVKYRQLYEQEVKGQASTEAGAAKVAFAKENAENFSKVRSRRVRLLDDRVRDSYQS